jgi:hypothetical protein
VATAQSGNDNGGNNVGYNNGNTNGNENANGLANGNGNGNSNGQGKPSRDLAMLGDLGWQRGQWEATKTIVPFLTRRLKYRATPHKCYKFQTAGDGVPQTVLVLMLCSLCILQVVA